MSFGPVHSTLERETPSFDGVSYVIVKRNVESNLYTW